MYFFRAKLQAPPGAVASFGLSRAMEVRGALTHSAESTVSAVCMGRAAWKPILSPILC